MSRPKNVFCLAISVLALCATDASAASRPNLVMQKVSMHSVTLAPGGKFAATAKMIVTGKKGANRSVTSFLLVPFGATDASNVTWVQNKSTPKLKKRGSKTLKVSLKVPLKLAAGKYTLAACGDALKKVKESKEADNCALSKGTLTVTALPVSSGPPAPDAPAPGPSVAAAANVTLPSISGSPLVGDTLTGGAGSWTPGGVFLNRTWLHCSDALTIDSCSAISGEEGATYSPVVADQGMFVRLRVTGLTAGGGTTATSAPTAAIQLDTDADGVGDLDDCAPMNASLPPAQHLDATSCAGTVYQANDGTANDGAAVVLTNVLVTAVASGGHAYVQIKPGDAGYTDAKRSGIEIAGAGTAVQGDRIDLVGILSTTSKGKLITTDSVHVDSSLNELTSKATITFTELTTASSAYDAVLVSLPSITIDSVDSAGWHLDLAGTPLLVAPDLYGTLPPATAGDTIDSLGGIADSADGSLTLLPRPGDVSVTPQP